LGVIQQPLEEQEMERYAICSRSLSMTYIALVACMKVVPVTYKMYDDERYTFTARL
jgi:hypothetical protein